MRRQFLAVGACALACLAACDRGKLSGPPTLRLGRDECAACGMMINEDRCSSADIVERNGAEEYALFDDIGCMLGFEQPPPDNVRVIEGFVHDHTTKGWISIKEAVFLVAPLDGLKTPMGSGIVAFRNPSDAETAQKDAGGRILKYEALVAERQASERSPRMGPAHDLPNR